MRLCDTLPPVDCSITGNCELLELELELANAHIQN